MLLWTQLRPLILSPMNRLQLPISKLCSGYFHRSSVNKIHCRRLTCSPKHWPPSSSNSCSNSYVNISTQLQPTAQFAFGATSRKFSNGNQNIQSARRHEGDNIGQEYSLIYSNSSLAYYKSAQLFLQPTMILSIIGAGYLCYMSKNDFFLQDHVNYFEHPFVAGCMFFVFNSYLFFIVTKVSQSYLLRIYVHEDENNFVAIVPGLFMSRSQLHFTANDVTLSSRNVVLPFKRGNSVIKGRSFILHTDDFLIPKYYDILHPAKSDDDNDEK
ncbi:Hypothetical predicted protein [Octopus vulgaris]|uniref:Uncharacterized protein n=1 Tax=Octopus vulgaris TaxID=6645 RepID=A0AA36C320_OCTVU|nr:Hypothetical predicted protein [Octopus vulgaris]